MFNVAQARPDGGWVTLATDDGMMQMAEMHLPYGPGYGFEERLERSNILMARHTVVMLTLMDLMYEDGK